MSDREWIYLINTFMVHGLRSYKTAFELSVFTDDRLAANVADPFFLNQYNTFHPLRQAIGTEYTDWISQKGIQKGSTLSFDNLLFALGTNVPETNTRSKINQWDVMVQAAGAQFSKGSTDYTAIFPLGHTPFMHGDKDQKIAVVAALSLTLGNYAALAAVKADVDAFLILLNAARLVQQGEMGDTEVDSGEVLVSVVAAMTGLWALYGALINHYPANPELVKPYFKLELLRNIQQTEWNRTVPKLTTENVFKRTLHPDRKIKITVNSSKPLKFFIAPEKNDTTAANMITVTGLEDEIITWGSIMNGAGSSFFNTTNDDPDVTGDFSIEILPEGT